MPNVYESFANINSIFIGNRVKNIRNDFEIPTHLSSKQGNPESENNNIHAFAGIFQLCMLFPTLDVVV